MDLSRSKGGLVAAGLLALAAGASLPAAAAEAQRGHGRAHHRDGTHGVIHSNGRAHDFYFHDDPCVGLVASFTSCGYDAWVHEGRVYVRYEGRRPRFRIDAPGFSFSVRYRDGCAIIKPRCLAPPPRAHRPVRVHRPVRGHHPVTIRWTGGDWCPPPSIHRHHRGPRWGHRGGARWGWSVKVGSRWHGGSWRHRPPRCR